MMSARLLLNPAQPLDCLKSEKTWADLFQRNWPAVLLPLTLLRKTGPELLASPPLRPPICRRALTPERLCTRTILSIRMLSSMPYWCTSVRAITILIFKLNY